MKLLTRFLNVISKASGWNEKSPFKNKIHNTKALNGLYIKRTFFHTHLYISIFYVYFHIQNLLNFYSARFLCNAKWKCRDIVYLYWGQIFVLTHFSLHYSHICKLYTQCPLWHCCMTLFRLKNRDVERNTGVPYFRNISRGNITERRMSKSRLIDARSLPEFEFDSTEYSCQYLLARAKLFLIDVARVHFEWPR